MSRKNQPKQVEEVVENKEEEEQIDPRIMAVIALNRKDKASEKEKQSKIYAAMANIKVVRN